MDLVAFERGLISAALSARRAFRPTGIQAPTCPDIGSENDVRDSQDDRQ
jgi:hypothetical protein